MKFPVVVVVVVVVIAAAAASIHIEDRKGDGRTTLRRVLAR
jgi:hypothetical protein